MIYNQKARSKIKAVWNGVEALRDLVQRSLLGAFAQGGSSAMFAADAANNLPFVHACSVLNEVLIQLAKEGKFKRQGRFLGSLVKQSEHALAWKDFPLIKQAVKRRNELAHHGVVLSRADCWKYTDAIKDQLQAWNIL